MVSSISDINRRFEVFVISSILGPSVLGTYTLIYGRFFLLNLIPTVDSLSPNEGYPEINMQCNIHVEFPCVVIQIKNDIKVKLNLF